MNVKYKKVVMLKDFDDILRKNIDNLTFEEMRKLLFNPPYNFIISASNINRYCRENNIQPSEEALKIKKKRVLDQTKKIFSGGRL